LTKAAPAQRTTYEPTANVELSVWVVTKPVSLAKYKEQVGLVVNVRSGFLVNEIVGCDPTVLPKIIEVAEIVGVITKEAARISKSEVALTLAKLESAATVAVTE